MFSGSFILLLIEKGKPSIDLVLTAWHMHNGSHPPSTAEYTIYEGYLLHRVVWLDPRTLWRDLCAIQIVACTTKGTGVFVSCLVDIALRGQMMDMA